VRASRSVSRPARLRVVTVGWLAAVVVLFAGGVALADTVTSDFEPPLFHLGSVNGQQGWKSVGPGFSASPTGEFDQAVVSTTVPSFGQQAFRISNAYASGSFDIQTFSAPVADAGEDQPNQEFIAQFSFTTTTTAYQPGLALSISPDNGVGERMAYVSLKDTPAGVAAVVQDTPDVDAPQDFVAHPVALLARGVTHTIKFWIKLNPGPGNDLVRVAIDGNDTGQCFTSWENFVRATVGQLSPINSLQFRTSVAAPDVVGGGYLFDNVTVSTSNGAGPPGCDVPIVKQADSQTVRAGGRIGYSISVRNRGSLTARNVRVCDHVPRRMTFLGADHRLLRLGRLRCLLIPRLAPGHRVSFHLTLHVAANAPPGTVDNMADVTPAPPPDSPETPPPADVPGPTTPSTDVPAKEATAKVKVLPKRAAPRRGRQPRFTG
jgi:uncharacterized repeat protein (TIGR01451 family)